MVKTYLYCRGWLVCALCLSAATGGCGEGRPARDVPEFQETEDIEAVRPEPVVTEESAAERRELQWLRDEAGRLEQQAAELERKVVELDDAKRRLVEQFQGIELAETVAAAGAGMPVREGVLAGNEGEGPGRKIFLWDKPGGFAAGASVAGQARAGDRVVVAGETVAVGKRWSRIFTVGGTASENGWIPSDQVSVTPSRLNGTYSK